MKLLLNKYVFLTSTVTLLVQTHERVCTMGCPEDINLLSMQGANTIFITAETYFKVFSFCDTI